jgi:type I restriction enzyme S subunit
MDTISPSLSQHRWRRYPKYKPSGVEWITLLPDHWKREKVSRVGSIKGRIGWRGYTSNDIRDENEGILAIGATQITKKGTIDLSKATFISKEKYEESPEIKLFGNEILIVKVGATIGKIGFFPKGLGEATINPNVMIFSSFKDLNRFIFYCLKGEYFQISLELNKSAGAQDAINQEFFNSLSIFSPPLPEQHAIAAFLDRETARIDTLIAKKERQIELLQEKRSALISHAVTKGLDPNVKMKDSGIEWLGMVPEGWKISHIRRIISKFVDYRGKTPEKVESGVRLITARNIKNGQIDFSLSEEFMKNEDYESWMVRGFPEIGDIIITTEAPLGEVAQIVDTDIALAQRIILLKTNKNQIHNEFLKYQLMSDLGKGELLSRSTGSTAIGIKAEHLRSISVIIPPLNEQTEVVLYIQREIRNLENPIEKIVDSINKLREYRSALISAAVTGKIDVRKDINA